MQNLSSCKQELFLRIVLFFLEGGGFVTQESTRCGRVDAKLGAGPPPPPVR